MPKAAKKKAAKKAAPAVELDPEESVLFVPEVKRWAWTRGHYGDRCWLPLQNLRASADRDRVQAAVDGYVKKRRRSWRAVEESYRVATYRRTKE